MTAAGSASFLLQLCGLKNALFSMGASFEQKAAVQGNDSYRYTAFKIKKTPMGDCRNAR